MIAGAARAVGIGAGLALLLALAACAPLAPAPSGSAPPPAPAPTGADTPVPGPTPATEPPRRATPAPGAMASDSTPSADAARVLATIPEPLGGTAAVPPPASPARDTTRPARAVAPEAGHDTLRTERPAEDDGGAVPVPVPTTPLRSAPVTVAPETTATRPPPATSAPPPAQTAPGSPTPVSPPPPASGECWRVQVAAPATREEADSRMSAAQSLLLVPMVVEREKGLHKVRTRDCLSREAADGIRRRAIDSGFAGSFVVKGSAAR